MLALKNVNTVEKAFKLKSWGITFRPHAQKLSYVDGRGTLFRTIQGQLLMFQTFMSFHHILL